MTDLFENQKLLLAFAIMKITARAMIFIVPWAIAFGLSDLVHQ